MGVCVCEECTIQRVIFSQVTRMSKQKSSAGAAKAQKRPPGASKGKKSSSSDLLVPAVILLPVLIAVFAYATYPGSGAKPTASKAEPQFKGKRAPVKAKELSPFELRQQGRKPPGSDRPRCAGRGVLSEA